MLLFIAFAAILTITFGTVAMVTGSSRSQKVIERRIGAILAAGDGATANLPQIQVLLKPTHKESNFDWLLSLLDRYKIPQMLEAKILQADVKTSPITIIFSSVGLAAAGFGVVYLWVPILAVQIVAALVFAYIPFGFLKFKASRRLKAFDAGLADAIDMMARALRAGHSMTASMNVVAEQSLEPVRSEFSEVFKQQNFGLPIRDAMQQMLDRVPSQDLRVMVTGILVQKETGGNLAEILDRTSQTIRERLKIQGEIRTHTAQGRMTGYILCALPVVMLIVINFLNPGYSRVLMENPTGRMISYIGIGLLIIGGLIIRQIINGIEV
jgi:tight adherence protein B